MAENLSGKTALITGGARRIGRAAAMALAEKGVNVVINFRTSASEANELAEDVRKLGVHSAAIQADVAAQEDLDNLIDRARDAVGPINILINNASIFPSINIDDLTFDELVTNIAIDAWAPLALGRKFAEQTESGHIINFLDTKVVTYDWVHVGYISAKHLLKLFTRMMAVRFAPGISVNAVAPGLILPPEGKDTSYLEALKDRVPLKRIGYPEYVTDAILFLVSSKFITGQTIFVDGGRHLNEALIG